MLSEQQVWIQLCSWESCAVLRLRGLRVSTWQLGSVFAWAVELEVFKACALMGSQQLQTLGRFHSFCSRMKCKNA